MPQFAKRQSSSKLFEKLDETRCYLKPTCYSKSLDHFQFSRENNIYSSFYNINEYLNNTKLAHSDSSCHRRCNSRNYKVYDSVASANREIFKRDYLSDTCDCDKFKQENDVRMKKRFNEPVTNSSIDLNVGLSNVDIGVNKRYKQFVTKNLTNVKQKCQKLVKSLSHTPSDSTQHIFRSSSMQVLSPSHTLLNGFAFGEETADQVPSEISQNLTGNVCVLPNIVNLVDVGENSSQSSADSPSLFDKRKAALGDALVVNVISLRKVKSAVCLGDYVSSVVLSGTESLPNITAFTNENVGYLDITRYSSSSSTCTSERSGWLSSRSSSVTSVETNRSALNNGIVKTWCGLEKLQSKIANGKSLKKYQKLDRIFVSDKG